MLNVSWRVWTSTWMRKLTKSSLMDKNDIQEMPWATHTKEAEDWGRITHAHSVHLLPQAPNDAAVGHSCWAQQTLSLTRFLSFYIPTCLHAWALRISSDLVDVFPSVSMTDHQGATTPLEENVPFVDILASNLSENEPASLCWFLAALWRTPKPSLQLQIRLFAMLTV